MSDNPKVSVVIPTHNRAHLVMRAVQSVLEQTLDDFELIVVDDCGTDNTREVIEACEDPRVSYAKTERNSGPAGARNTGIRLAKGEYLAFLDSDDEWLPEKLAMQVEVFETTSLPNLGAVHGAILCVPETGYVYSDSVAVSENEWIYPAPQFRGDAFVDVLAELGMPGTGSIIMVHRNVIDAGIFFDESLPAYEDYEYLLHVSKTFQLETLNTPLDRKYEDHGGPRVWNNSATIAGGMRIIEKYRDDLANHPRIVQRRELAVATAYAREGDMAEARRHTFLMVKASPFYVAAWVVLAASYVSERLFLKVHPLALANRPLQKIRRNIVQSISRRFFGTTDLAR